MGSIVKDKSRLPFNDGWRAFIEETGAEIRGHTWGFLKSQVGAYLDKNGLNVGDREAYLHSAVCKALVKAGKGGMCIGSYPISAAQSRTKAYEADPRKPVGLRSGKPGYDGRAWAVWHLAAADGKLTPAYASELLKRIGCGSCQSHARKYISQHPVPNAGAGEQFAWTVKFHSHVSASIGKPIVSVEAAKQIWKA